MQYQSSPFIQRPTTWPTNNGLLMRNVAQLCLAANNILLIRKRNHAFLLLVTALAWKWLIATLPENTLKNELGDRMIKQLLNSVIAKYRDLSVSCRLIISLSRSACHLQITSFCSTSSDNCWLFISETITSISTYNKGGSNTLFGSEIFLFHWDYQHYKRNRHWTTRV